MSITGSFTCDDISSRLRYEPESGLLFRVKSRGRWLAGQEMTGTINSAGYRVVSVSAMPVLVHRIAFMLMERAWPLHQIDHINRDKLDNRWLNLREATLSQNNLNVVRRERDLPVGVRMADSGRFIAEISIEGRSNYLGMFDTPAAAHDVYLAARLKRDGDFMPLPLRQAAYARRL